MSSTQSSAARLIGWILAAFLALAGQAAWAAPVATTTFSANNLLPFINEPTTAEACLQNTGTSGSVGYQPVLELIVPNGYTVTAFSYLGTTITPKEATGSPCANPAGCTLASPLQSVMPGRTRTIANGERYLTLEYPLGSFPDTQPKQCISFTLQPNAPTAVVGAPNTFNFTPIFTLGADPLNNPTAVPPDPPIVGAAQNLTVTPQVIKHTKRIIAPEKETATGQNFKRIVELTVDVANNATVSGITVADILPNSFQFVGITDAAGCTVTSTPSTTTPGGTLTLNCGAMTGVVGVDKTIKFEFYIPEFDREGNRVLNPANPGGGVSITNNSTANGTYTGNPVSAAGQDVITAKAHATQKSVVIFDSSGNAVSGRGPRPTDRLRYTIVGQISDYFRVNNAVLTDVLGDGQTFRPGFTPTWGVTQNGATTNGIFTLASNFIAAAKVNGQTTLTINLSTAMGAGSSIIGDESDSPFNGQPATYQIVFESTVDAAYTGSVSGTAPLSAGDSVANTANVNSAVLGEAAPHNPTGGNATDGAGTSVTIEGPTLNKSTYAVDGNTTLPNPLVVRPGQTVTYRIQYTMPFVSFENLTLTDYLPIPKLRATEVTVFDATGATTPPAGQWKFGPAHTSTAVTSGSTTLTRDAAQNTLTWSFGNVESQNEGKVIDILFTVTMTTDAIADNLNLANLVQITSKNSSQIASSIDKVTNITTAEPILRVVKDVRNTRAGSPGFSNSTTNADAGDVIEYRITVTNIGNGSAHKIKLTDDANTLGYYGSSCTALLVDVTSTGSLFAGTLVFTNPLTGNGDATVNPGEQATVTYQCTIQPTAVPNAQNSLDNTAAVTEYFSTATSPTNLAPAGFGVLSDKATVGIQEIQSLTKAITASSVPGSTPNSNINNGETLTFFITATLSEGTYAGFALTDNTTTIPSPITCGSNGFTCTNLTVAGGTATVTATNGSTPGVITYTYTQAKTASGTNTATASATNATSRTASANWTVDDPNPVITKTFNPAGGVSAGDTVQVQLGWSNTDSDNPMFRCVISDVLDANVFDATPVSPVSTPTGYAFNYDSGTRTVTYTATDLENPCPTVAAGGAVFSARIKNNVVTGNYTNTAAIATQTLPLSQTGGKAVNANVTTPVPISAPTVSGKTITATSQADTSGANVAIGETVTYQIVFRMAEGNTNNVTLIDQIAAGTTPLQLVYIPGTATLARNSATLSAANNPGGVNSATAGVAVPVTVTASGQDVAVDLGNVVNNDANVASQETYTLTLQFRVGNVAANVGGRQLQNRSRLSYTPFGSGTAQFVNGPSATVRVVVPQVVVNKVVTPAAGAAGNIETYALTVRNIATGVNAASAYDYAFSDLLPTDITPTGTPTANVGSTGAVVSSLTFSGQTLSGMIDKLDPGEAITITYPGQISLTTPFGRMLVNSARADATSLPGSDANERTGSGNGPNNLFAGTSAAVTTQTVTMTKALKNPKTFYAIGEEVEYELRLALPVGSATGMNVLDTLPSGLSYVPGSAAISIVGGVTAPTVGSITPTAASPLTFALGAVAANPAGEVVISYRAKVDNSIANQDGAVRTNNARVSYDNPNPNGVSPLIYTVPNPPSIRIGEPNLEMTKSILAGAANAQAGSVVRWQFTVSNIGNTGARQIAVNDTLPANLTVNNPANLTVASVGGVSKEGGGAVAASDFTAIPASSTVTAANLVLEPGATLTVAYDTGVGAGAVAGNILNNVVTAAYNSLPVGGVGGRDASGGQNVDDDNNVVLNNYRETAGNALQILSQVTIDKQVSPVAAAVGEIVTYALRIDLIQGTTNTVIIEDVLPTGLEYVSHAISVGNIGLTLGNPAYDTRLGSGQIVRFDLGNVVNPANGDSSDDFVLVEIFGRVRNFAANQNGVAVLNGDAAGSPITVTYNDGAPRTITFDHDAATPGDQGIPFTVVEPALGVAKTASPTAQALTDVVTYNLTVSHLAGSAADAYDVALVDTIPAGMSYIANSVNPPPAFVSFDSGTRRLTLGYASLPLAEGSRTISYQARVDAAATVGLPLNNSVALTWASQSGAAGGPSSGRTGADGAGGALNDYAATSTAAVTPTAAAVITAVKTVTDLNGGVANPGDLLEYAATLTNTSSETVANVIFTDPIPANTAYVANSLSLNGVPATNSGAATQVQLNLGSLLPGASATIRFRVTINAGTANGVIISNQGIVDSDQTVPTPTDGDGDPANGAQPTTIPVGNLPVLTAPLYAEKTVAWTDVNSSGTVNAGDTLRYTVILRNRGASTLTGLSFSDVIPTGLSYIPASASASSGTATVAGQNLSWTGLTDLAPGAFHTLRFDVTINPFAGTEQTFSNQGAAISTQTGNVRTDGNGDPTDGPQPTVISAVSGAGAPNLDVQKRAGLAVDVAGDGVVTVGDTLRYTLIVSNHGSAAANDARIVDNPLPPQVTLVAGSVLTNRGGVVSESPLTINIGNLNPGELATISFQVTINSGAGGQTASNQATATAANIVGSVVSDNDGNAPNGRNPTLTPILATPIGQVSGTVFNDFNGDGVQQPSEAGLPSVTVQLFDSAGALVATTTTNASGGYQFTNVPIGAYTVRETDRPGFVSTTNNIAPVSVTAGVASPVNFGDQQTGTVSGVVFNDPNGNGRIDSGETGLSGGRVELLDRTGGVVATATVTADGGYAFANVPPGAYVVRETDPAGFVSTTSNTIPVSVAPNGSATANFGDQQVGAVSGAVFNDLNGNSVQDPGEVGISGVTVTLTPASGGASRTAITGSDGVYLFTAVTPGAYSVIETDPSGFVSTTSNTVLASVPSGGAAIANFGDQQVGTVSGAVFNDLNGNGQQNAGELGIGGVTVELRDGAGNIVQTAITDPSGRYQFVNVIPGNYSVREIDPAGYISTTPNDVAIITVPPGGIANANFGDRQIGSVAGHVFNDLNGSGVQDPGEAGIGGVRIDLVNAQGTVVQNVLTAGDGSYFFPAVPSGAYTVRETDPADYVSTTPNDVAIAVPPGGAASANFGDRQIGSVAGRVFNDLNGNSVQDSGELGIGGVTVELLDSAGNVARIAKTDAAGGYGFFAVAPGAYTVRETDPSGFASTTPNDVAVTVPANGSATANFGDQQQGGAISGVVFNDRNGNGIQEAGEPGIGGVTVELRDGAGSVVQTATTDANGRYQFVNMTPGAYTVRETDPSGFASTTPNDVAVTVPANGSATANFGDQQQGGAISGVVFNDRNGNGIQEAGEPGIGGVTVELRDGAGSVVQTATTDANGRYQFVNMTPGAYTVRETDPSGFASTTPNDVAVTVPANGSATANFGDQQQGGAISGVVFNDLNGNGVQETGEPGISGVTLTLKNSQGVTVALVTTASDGRYAFTGVTAGNYQIVETDPAGYASTTVNTVPVTVTDGGTATIHFGDQINGSNLRADVLLFPYFAVSDTVTSVVSVINRADQNGGTVPRPQTLHYRIYSKNGATADNLTAPCEEFDVRRVTSPNDVVTFDLTGHYGDRLGVLAEPADRQAKANYAAQNQSFAFMKGLQPARGFLVVDNNEAPNTSFEPSLAGDLMVIDFSGGAAWGYPAYNAAPSDTSAPMAYNFEDAAERMGEVLAGNRAITPTDLNGGASPSVPVNLLPFASATTSGGMQTRFLVTPIGHSVTFPTGTTTQPLVESQTQLRSDLTTQLRLQVAFATGDANDVIFDRDENPVSGQAPQNVTCVGAVNVETLLSAGALREIGEYGGWSGLEVRSPGALASLSTTIPPSATRTNNTNQATVIKLEFSPDGRFLGESFKGSSNNALWLRRGIRESIFGTGGGAPGVIAPRLRIRSAADSFGYPVDVANDFVRDSLGVSPY